DESAIFPSLNSVLGGTMLTYKMASLYDTSISVDDTDEYTTRQGTALFFFFERKEGNVMEMLSFPFEGVYGMSYPFSPRYSARYLQVKRERDKSRQNKKPHSLSTVRLRACFRHA